MKTYKVKKCFQSFGYRDSDLDSWLSKELPIVEDGKVSYKTLEKDMTFKEMVQEFLGSTDIEVIKNHSFSLQQIEKMTKDPEKYRLLTNGYANIFLIIDGDKVFGLSVLRRDDWRVFICSFGYVGVWSPGRRFFSRNSPLESKTLGTLDTSLLPKELTINGIKYIQVSNGDHLITKQEIK